MSGEFDEAKGRAKQAAGDLTDDDELRQEGETDETTGKIKQAVDDVKDHVDDVIDRARDRVR